MFKFLKSNSTPLPLRILHFLQLLISLPAYLISSICVLGLIVVGVRSAFILVGPWIFSSISNDILLYKEKSSAQKGQLSKQRYLRIQLFKLGWTVLFYIPLVVAIFAVKGMIFAVLAVLLHKSPFWRSIVWFNGLHWFFVFVTLTYSTCCFRGQTEGTIRLQNDEPIHLDIDPTANDEEIARHLQSGRFSQFTSMRVST